MNALELRRRTLGKGVYKKTVEGNPAIAQGSLARRHPGITMQGWTEQAQYEGNQLIPLPVGKVIKSESGKNTLTVTENGVNLNITEPTTSEYTNDIYIFGNSQYNIENGYEDASVYIPQGLYTLLNDTITNVEVFLSVWRNGAKIDLVLSSVTRPVNFTIMDGDKIRLGIRPKGTLEINNMMLMVIKQTLPSTTPFEPYTGRQPSPNPDYPQAITSAGKYDEGTGKYQYEITLSDNADRAQNLTLISDRPLTKWDRLEKRAGVWGWVYKSAEVVLDGSENYVIYDRGAPGYPSILFSHNMTGKKMGQNNLYCEQLKYSNNIFNEKNLEYCYMGYNANNGVYIGISTGENVTNVSEFKAWLSENPITFLYETAKETFVPLSESEQEQMNVLYTFRPTTVLSNDCECEMTLAYKTKKSLQPVSGGYKEV